MVNTGGPSKGCLTCIKRKIRVSIRILVVIQDGVELAEYTDCISQCDRQRPTCGQCQKSNRQCAGYRDVTDLMFRDQSQNVIAKGRAASYTQAQGSLDNQNFKDSDSTDVNATGNPDRSTSDTPAISHSPKLSEEGGLISFFTNNFTCTMTNKGSNLLWIPANLDDLLKEDCARYSVQSVGAMALARLRRSPYYHREAQKNYGLALIRLQQHVEAPKDAVLVTILFLGFFEVLASYDESSRRSWTTHLGGLGLLLRKCDPRFLTGEFGARMLLQSRSQVVLNALQTKKPIPATFQNLAQGFQRSMAPGLVHSDDADMLLIRLATHQAQYHISGSSNALLSELVTLQDDLYEWTRNLSPSWFFSPRPYDTPYQFWWEARYDIYSLPIICHVWNKTRAARIIVHDLIQEISLHLSLVDEANNEIPTNDIQHLVTGICATVPAYYRPSAVRLGPDIVENQPLLGTTYWLLWVLEVVGSMREASSTLTEWIRQCLERIYETTGIVKAQLAAQRLKWGHGSVVVA